jgi:hypothetical protein
MFEFREVVLEEFGGFACSSYSPDGSHMLDVVDLVAFGESYSMLEYVPRN